MYFGRERMSWRVYGGSERLLGNKDGTLVDNKRFVRFSMIDNCFWPRYLGRYLILHMTFYVKL